MEENRALEKPWGKPPWEHFLGKAIGKNPIGQNPIGKNHWKTSLENIIGKSHLEKIIGKHPLGKPFWNTLTEGFEISKLCSRATACFGHPETVRGGSVVHRPYIQLVGVLEQGTLWSSNVAGWKSTRNGGFNRKISCKYYR